MNTEQLKLSSEEVLQRWQRRNKRNKHKKITLKEICEELGVNYAKVTAYRHRRKLKKPKRKLKK